MGYYIPNNIPIENRELVTTIPQPTSLNDVEEDEAIIVSVDNISFKAYGFCYSEDELRAFTAPEDRRSKEFYKMPLEAAKELSGYRERS